MHSANKLPPPFVQIVTGYGFYRFHAVDGASGAERQPDQELKMVNDGDMTGGQVAATDNITERERNHSKAAWPWIKENKQRLIAAGWTRAALLQHSKFRWPLWTLGRGVVAGMEQGERFGDHR